MTKFSEMTSKERMLAAITGKLPDRVPCTPDFSNMIPCRLTGRPFWDIYLHNMPTLYKAYSDAVDYYGIDGWFSAGIGFKREGSDAIHRTTSVREDDQDRIFVRTTTNIDGAGTLSSERMMFRTNPPVTIEKPIKDLKRDFPIYKKQCGKIIGYDLGDLEEKRALCGDRGIFCLSYIYPGVHIFTNEMNGGAQDAIFACYDEPEIIDEWVELIDRDAVKIAEVMLDQKPDVLEFSGSGTLTLSNPEMVRKYSLPTIKKITRMSREAGIPTMLHSCGLSMAFLKMLYEETDLNCINPLEKPPMGDVDLAEVKKLYGDKLCLMGNLNTTDMLMYTPEQVKAECRKAIDAAGANGRFILSTGDQLGRDTPDENIFAMVETAKNYGRYNG